MPLTGLGKNQSLLALKGTAPTTPITHIGALVQQAGKAVTGTAATDIFTSTAHGFSAGDLVVFGNITGGAGIQAGNAADANGLADPYFVIAANLAANTFQVSRDAGGTAIDFTTDMTSGTVYRLVELSGGSPAYARVAIAFNNPAGGLMDDSTNGATVNVPAGNTVSYGGLWNGASAGTLVGIQRVTDEAFAAQGTYQFTDVKIDLNA